MQHLTTGRVFAVIALLVVVGLEASRFGLANESPQKVKDVPASVQWEYTHGSLGTLELVRLGEEGWEAYAATQLPNTPPTIYLKRIKKQRRPRVNAENKQEVKEAVKQSE